MTLLTAAKMGFYDGHLVRPGETFEFDDMGFRTLPKWAVPEGTPLPEPKKPFGKPPVTADDIERHAAQMRAVGLCDTRPPAAQLAFYEKTGLRPHEPHTAFGFHV